MKRQWKKTKEGRTAANYWSHKSLMSSLDHVKDVKTVQWVGPGRFHMYDLLQLFTFREKEHGSEEGIGCGNG